MIGTSLHQATDLHQDGQDNLTRGYMGIPRFLFPFLITFSPNWFVDD